jgi:hypothetical protein
MMKRVSPRLPSWPMTIRSARHSTASSRICSAAWPRRVLLRTPPRSRQFRPQRLKRVTNQPFGVVAIFDDAQQPQRVSAAPDQPQAKPYRAGGSGRTIRAKQHLHVVTSP